MYALTVFVGMNIIVVYSKILPITEENSQGGYKIGIGAILIALFITNYILFLHKNKYKQIIKLYKNESLRSRKTGSFVVIFYMVLSIAILILA